MPDYSKPDHWSIKAQKEGYPARSVYKLKEMDEKFGLLKGLSGPFRVLDLGSAPGSWSLYVMRSLLGSRSGKNSGGKTGGLSSGAPAGPAGGPDFSLVSVDLAPLSRQHDQGLFDRPDFCFIQGDFDLPELRQEILSRGPYNLILSDAAPATSGNRSLDSLRSLALGETALNYAETAMAPGGNLVIKVFQGGDTGGLLKAMRGLFGTSRSFKPAACRAGSFETYFLGLKYSFSAKEAASSGLME